jgi:CelD/BcsL family acetyltransferase involved in cellulose biosynthesis
MHIEVHNEVEPLLPEWGKLFRADPEATPFVSPGYARAWWTHWGEGSRPWILTVHDGEEVIGLAAFTMRRRGPLRIVRVYGEKPADYWDVLALPERRDEVTRAVVDAVARRRGQWDALALKRLPSGSHTGGAFSRSGLRLRANSPEPYPVLELPSTFDDYLAALPSSRRSNLRRHLRRLDEGELELRDVREPEALSEAIDRWQRFRVEQWNDTGRELDPDHASSLFRDFTLDVALELAPAGLCLVWELLRDGEPVATYVNFADDRRFYFYLGGFLPSVARLGIGKIVIAHGIRTSIEAGRREYDFLMGSEQYKYWYGAVDRPSPSLLLHSGRPRSRLAVRFGTATGRL